ncbi:MAG: ATP-binding protein [Ottowia sp.]|nr:HAMP domain-containing protein [Ottowia sp.]
MVRRFSLADKLLAIGAAFFMVALLAISFLSWASWHFENETLVALQGERLRADLLGMEMARHSGSREGFARLEKAFSQRLDALTHTDSAGPLHLPLGVASPDRYASIAQAWARVRADVGAAHATSGWPAQVAGQLTELTQEVDAFARGAQETITMWAARVHLAHLLLLLLAVSAACVSVLLGHALVLRPIGRLRRVLRDVSEGQLQTRLPVETDDELGQLAAGFNRMASALQASRDDLEGKVRDKTASIKKRNEQLSALYAVSALAARATDLNELTQGFAERIRSVAGCDATAVWLSDEDNSRYTLFAMDGLPEMMVSHETELVAGACACCPVPGESQLRVTPVLPDDDGLPYCHEAGFTAVVSVPIEWQHRVLGQATLLYRRAEETPSEATQNLLQAMARHFASAMENLRVVALEREAAVTSERKLLARELHDSIAQSLAFLKIQVGLLRTAISREDVADRDRTLAELDTGVRECLADVRELLVHFRTRTQDEDIGDALRSTVSKFKHQTGMAARLSFEGHGVPLAPDVQIHLLHMVQEALSNVRKHAAATQVDLHVQRHPFWRIKVHDTGVGFDPEQVATDRLHVGLEIMRERAERIGARLQVTSAPGRGTQVVIELPDSRIQQIEAAQEAVLTVS